MKKLKINIHITKKCNYSCKYCFALFGEKKDISFNSWKKIIKNCSKEYDTSFNIAGGEPLLYKDLGKVLNYIKNDLNKFTSIITNGYFVDEKWIKENIKNLDVIGFSIDSFDEDILKQMGRISKNQTITKERFSYIYNLIKKYNPNCKIKVNTVVSSLNTNDTSLNYLNNFNIDRLKLLKMQIFREFDKNGQIVFDNKDYKITDKEFKNYIENNKIKTPQLVLEYNMENSYIIIDNIGNFVDDSNEKYEIIGNLLEDDFSNLMDKYNFNKKLYDNRYK